MNDLGIVAATAFMTSLGAVAAARAVGRARKLVDLPNDRSSHWQPVPRLGGVGVVLGIIAGVMVTVFSVGSVDPSYPSVFVPMSAAVLISAVGFIDDLTPLSSRVRLSAHVAVATGYCMLAGPLAWLDLPGLAPGALGWVAWPVSVFWLVWMTNLYNFMDGIDGIAGVQAVVAGAFVTATANAVHDTGGAAIGMSISAASLAFLAFNWHPASIFMGDVGSTSLGFLFGALAIRTANLPQSPLPFVASVLLLGAFVFDASFTLIRRIVRREPWYQAHRSHLYQLPQRWGISHARVTTAAAVMMALFGLAAVGYSKLSAAGQMGVLAGSACALCAVVRAVLQVDARFPRREGRTFRSADATKFFKS